MDDLKFINLNHPDGMEKYRKMYGWKVCGFCEKSYNPQKSCNSTEICMG